LASRLGDFFGFIRPKTPRRQRGFTIRSVARAQFIGEQIMSIITKGPKSPEATLCAVRFSAKSMSTKRDIDFKKLGIEVDDLPAGSKKVWKENALPVEFFGKYSRLRQRAELRCHDHAASTDHGWITIKKRAALLLEDLEEIRKEWYACKEQDLVDYEDIRIEHLDKIEKRAMEDTYEKGILVYSGLSPRAARALRDAVENTQPTLEQIDFRLSFASEINFHVLDDDLFDPEFFGAQQNAVVAIRDSTMGALIKEVCATAGEVLKVILKNEKAAKYYKDLKTNGKTVKRIDVLKDKLYDLSFIHPHIKTVHDAMELSLQKLSSRNTGLRGSEHFSFRVLIESLTNQHELLAKIETKQPIVVIHENVNSPLESDSLFNSVDTSVDDNENDQQLNINNLDKYNIVDETAKATQPQQISIFM
jgi:hypothetical protein